MAFLKDLRCKRWLRKHDCKLAGGLSSLNKKSRLVIEEHVHLGHMDIDAKVLEIGAHTYIRSGSHLFLVSSIGRFCSFGTGVIVGQEKNNHPVSWLSTHPFQYTDTANVYDAPMEMSTIGHDVWIGHDAMILEGVNVGTGAVIATRAVVTSDVPPYAIVAGVPAKIVNYRHPPELIERLLASKWWELEVQVLQQLPLNDPQASLQQIEQMRGTGVAHYRKLNITRDGCEAV